MADDTTVEETETDDTSTADETEETTDDQLPKGDDVDWKSQSRKHERRAKQTAKELEDARARLAKIEEANQTEQERALEQARKEAAEQARSEVDGRYRKKILRAEIRAQAAGKFADPDDAIRLLDLEDDDVFDDEGEVQTAVLTNALDDLLERKPHLRADTGSGRPKGGADGGKGAAASTNLDDMSVEEHLKRIQKRA